MKSSLIVALDVPAASEVSGILPRLPAEVAWFKVGLELFCAEGPRALHPLLQREKHVFLDLKLHDIPRTVERSVQAVSALGVRMLTIHASGGRAMMEAAAAAAAPAGITLLAVTALTSLDAQDFQDLGISRAPSDHVLKLTELAVSSGVRGIVCSPHEARGIRAQFGNDLVIVTPGIRFADSATGDQKRIGSPGDAVRDGANFLVVGRPILESADPAAAARRVLTEMAQAES